MAYFLQKPLTIQEDKLTHVEASDTADRRDFASSTVLFSDESAFTVNNHAGNNYVRRRPKEQYRPYCISPTIKHPQSIMVWGCMAANGVGRLEVVSGMMNGTKYIDVLERKMLPSARSLFSDNQWIF